MVHVVLRNVLVRCGVDEDVRRENIVEDARREVVVEYARRDLRGLGFESRRRRFSLRGVFLHEMIDIVRVLVASLVLLGVVDFDGGFLDVSFRFDFGNRRLRRRRRERLLFGVALGAVVVRRFIFRIVRSVTRRFVGDRRRAAAVVVERERVGASSASSTAADPIVETSARASWSRPTTGARGTISG